MNSSNWQRYRLFFREFRQHFQATGAIAPSSQGLARAITQPLAKAAGRRPLRVLEVGAGTGVFTHAILERLGPADQLDVYEINPVFQPFLEAELRAARAQAQLHMSDIMQMDAGARYDFIVSGLPLNNFPIALVRAILSLLMSHLEPGGTLSYFEYPFLRTLKYPFVRDAEERQRLRGVGTVVEHFLRQHPSRAQTVAWNLPPAVARHVSHASA